MPQPGAGEARADRRVRERYHEELLNERPRDRPLRAQPEGGSVRERPTRAWPQSEGAEGEARAPDGLPPGRGGGIVGRRTVTIQGRGAERYHPADARASRHRPPPRAYERAGLRPDRVAMWAVLLGVVLVLAAATSSHAAPLRTTGRPASPLRTTSSPACPPLTTTSSHAPSRRAASVDVTSRRAARLHAVVPR